MWAIYLGSVPPVQWQNTNDCVYSDNQWPKFDVVLILYVANSAYGSLEIAYFP